MPGGSYKQPGNWVTLKRRILNRDGHVCFCGEPAVTVDHSIGVAEWAARGLTGTPHDEANLRAICQSCHDIKSKAEAASGRRSAAQRRRTASRIPIEPHPGAISPHA